VFGHRGKAAGGTLAAAGGGGRLGQGRGGGITSALVWRWYVGANPAAPPPETGKKGGAGAGAMKKLVEIQE
jgi:hypothetical protein